MADDGNSSSSSSSASAASANNVAPGTGAESSDSASAAADAGAAGAADAPAAPAIVTVNIKTLNGPDFELAVARNVLVSELKTKVREQTDVEEVRKRETTIYVLCSVYVPTALLFFSLRINEYIRLV